MYCSGVSSNVVGKSMRFFIYGGFLTGAAVKFYEIDSDGEFVLDDDDERVFYDGVILSASDSEIEVQVPSVISKFSVVIENSSSEAGAGNISVVEIVDSPAYGHPEKYNQNDFDRLFRSLMPKSYCFDLSSYGTFGKVIALMAFALSYVWSLVVSLDTASDPVHSLNLDEWEHELALPEKGVVRTSDSERRAEVVRKAIYGGGVSVNYFRQIANLFGFDCEIYEYNRNPEKFSSSMDSDERKPYYWMIKILSSDEITLHRCTCNDHCNRPLAWWEFSNFENLINKLKPAHTVCLFAYPEPTSVIPSEE